MSANDTAISPPGRVHRSAKSIAAPFERAVGAVARFVDAFVTSYRASRDIRDLQALSDEILRDIGIHRSEIVSLVYERTYNGVDRRHGQH